MKIIHLDIKINNWPSSAILVHLGVMTVPKEGLCANYGLESKIQFFNIISGTTGAYMTKTTSFRSSLP